LSIADNVRIVREKIEEAARISGRRGSDITLVAASKTNGADKVRQAIDAGVDAVGENRVQELLQKYDEGAYTGAPLHFIGHLQTNKINALVGKCDLIESVESAEQLTKISRRAVELRITQGVLLEINIGGEASKSGLAPEKLDEILSFSSSIPGIIIHGLMAIPPILGNFGLERHFFDDMYELFVDNAAKKYDNVSMQILSMGMSDSYVAAISAGASMVRIGSAIFGARS
jgi:pyridoxal phosphate enzyme (YggS family)